ncbi:MAG: hypothetical protein ACPG8W_12835 [Candidatus Promineifilaceae bacterium]
MQNGARRIRMIVTLILFGIGILLVGLSLSAELIGLNFTSGFGVVQMAELVAGLTFLTLSGFLRIQTLRQPESPRSLQADIGVRLAATGLVFCYVAGFSDILQIGTHCTAEIRETVVDCIPVVGNWQLGGIVLGVISIAIGMALYFTSRGTRPVSSLEFVIQDPKQK